MPVVRTRCERIEGGRGYPRLKWSDLSKSVVLANDMISVKEPNFSDRSNLINGRSGSNCGENCRLRKERRQVEDEEESPAEVLESSFLRRGEALYSDPEESISESDSFSDSNAETSLIYSRFRTSPDNGSVRMAFKVPLTKMTSLSNLSVTTKKENQQTNLSTIHFQERGSSVLEKNNLFSNGGNNKDEVPEFESRSIDSLQVSDNNDAFGDKQRNVHARLPKPEIIYLKTKARRYKARCDRSCNDREMGRSVDNNRVWVDEEKISFMNTQNQINFGDFLCDHDNCSNNFRAHRYKCTNKDPVRAHSFWHEIKTGGQSCLSSQRSRLREGTFIISPSEITSRVIDEPKRPQHSVYVNKAPPKGSLPILDRLYYLPKINLKFPPSTNNKWDETTSSTISQNALKSRAFTRGSHKSTRGNNSDPVIVLAKDSDRIFYNGIKNHKVLGNIRCVNTSYVDLPCAAIEMNYGHHAGGKIASCIPEGLVEVSYVPRYSASRAPFLITSSSHIGLRCYPFVHCHPLPKNSAVYPYKNCLHPASKPYPEDSSSCYSMLTKYFPNVSNKPAGLTQCIPTQCHYSSRCPHHPHHFPRPLKSDLSKKPSPVQLGLTFRNRHAVLNSADNLSSKKVFRKETRTVLQKKSWLSLLCLQNIVGQRTSCGVGTLPTIKPTSQPTLKNSAADLVNKCSSAKSSPVSLYVSSSQSYSPRHPVAHSTESKRSVKTALKIVTGKKNLKTRVGSAIQPKSEPISPAVLHGRISQKTASVSPAQSNCIKANSGQASSLTRFGFKRSSLIASGESTDSVNSILSDAQTTFSSNSNIGDLAEVNVNFSSYSNSNALQKANVNDRTHLNLDLDNDATYQKFDNDIAEDYTARSSRDTSPCTISQASSGVTSSAINGKLKAQTRQLPEPQTVTVKSLNCKNQPNLVNNRPLHRSSPTFSEKKTHGPSIKNSSSLSLAKTVTTPEIVKRSKTGKRNVIKNSVDTINKLVNTVKDTPHVYDKDINASQSNFSLVMPKVQGSKIPQTKSSLQKSQRLSRDSESSIKSLNTPDSGLGSSSESDKSKASDTVDVKKQSRNVSGKGNDCFESTILSKEEKVDLDVSDIWLKEKNSSLSCKTSLGANESLFRSTEKKQLKDCFKDKRDTTITYGMARQKFAPYSRPRMSYQNAISKAPSSVTNGNIPKTNITQNGKVPNTGVVRNRIEQIEKTPMRGNSPEFFSTKKYIPKKPFARPTTIEKTPIVVTPTSENTVELSRPVCRMLEYSEAKSCRLETRKEDNKDFEDEKTGCCRKDSPPTAQDVLIVASYEMKKDSNKCNEQIKTPQSKSLNQKLPNYFKNVKTVCHKDFTSDIESGEGKRAKDMVECEFPLKRELESTEVSIAKPESISHDKNGETMHVVGEKGHIDEVKLSPNESELSFEVLESPENEVSLERGTNTSHVNDYLSKLIVDMSHQCSDSNSNNTKHSQASPIRVGSVKKSRSEMFVNSVNVLSFPQLSNLVISEDSEQHKVTATPGSSQNSFHSSSLMNTSKSSVDSNGMENLNDTPRMSDSCERSGISGKCTPTLSNSNMDQDFLIDDEISDQPGLTFGDELDNSFLGDELLFPDEISANSLLDLKTGHGRTRHESMGTTSNISGDDLMLDYEAEEHASSKGIPKHSKVNPSSTNEAGRSEPVHIVIPGPRYEEDVLSPVACEIFNEWTAMMAEVKEDIGSTLCHSHDGAEADSSASTTADLTSSAAFNYSSVNAHQPLSNGFNPAAVGYRSQSFLPSGGCCRPKSYAGTAYDHLSDDHKKGHLFKPPRQGGSVSEQDGGVTLDRTSYHYICQDVTAMKTLLFRLRRILQVAETINPFDPSLNTNIYMSLGANDVIGEQEEEASTVHLDQENVDLKRQVVLLQQRLEEKDRSIRILQQQLSQALQQHQQHCNSTKSSQILTSSTDSISTASSKQLCCGRCDLSSSSSDKTEISNAATQTERPSHQRSTIGLNSVSHSTTIEDGLGPTVSSEGVDKNEALCNHFDSDFLVSENFCIKYLPVAVLSEVHLNSSVNKSSSAKVPAVL